MPLVYLCVFLLNVIKEKFDVCRHFGPYLVHSVVVLLLVLLFSACRDGSLSPVETAQLTHLIT